MGRLSALVTVSMAAPSIVLTNSESGFVPIVQLMTKPSKQWMMGERYTFPAFV